MTYLEYNFVPNPKFGSGALFWTPYPALYEEPIAPPMEVVSSVPWGALPDGAVGAGVWGWTPPYLGIGNASPSRYNMSPEPVSLQTYLSPIDPELISTSYYFSCLFGAPSVAGAVHAVVSGVLRITYGGTGTGFGYVAAVGELDTWNVAFDDVLDIRWDAGADSVTLMLQVFSVDAGMQVIPDTLGYATLVRVSAAPFSATVDELPYKDGDSTGWRWLGGHDASTSAGSSGSVQEESSTSFFSGPWAAPGKILVAWGGATPTYSGTERIFPTYQVFRSAGGRGFTFVGVTRADCWYDTDVVSGISYAYQVKGITSAGESEVVYTSPAVATPLYCNRNIQPSPPSAYTIATTPGGRRHVWESQPDYYRRKLLGYFVEDGCTEQQPCAFIRENCDFPNGTFTEPVSSWDEPAAEGERYFRLRAVDADLNISDPSDIVRGIAGGTGGIIGDDALFMSTYVGEGATIGDYFNGAYSPWASPHIPHEGRQNIGEFFTAGDNVMVRENAIIGNNVILSSWAEVAPDEVVPDGTER